MIGQNGKLPQQTGKRNLTDLSVKVLSRAKRCSVAEPWIFIFSWFVQVIVFLFDGFLNGSPRSECLFGQVIDLTVQNHFETFDGIFNGHHRSGYSGKLFGHGEGCENAAHARFTVRRSSSDNSSIPKMEIISCNSLLRCRICFTRWATS